MMTVQNDTAESALTKALNEALVALGRAGRPEQASRIAARAYVDIRHTAPQAAQKLNNVLHGLVRMPGMPADPSDPRSPIPTNQGDPDE